MLDRVLSCPTKPTGATAGPSGAAQPAAFADEAAAPRVTSQAPGGGVATKGKQAGCL